MKRTTPLLSAFVITLALSACSGSKRGMEGAVPVEPGSRPGSEQTSDHRAEMMRLFMEATPAQLTGRPTEALQKYQRCLKLEPSNGAVLFELAKAVPRRPEPIPSGGVRQTSGLLRTRPTSGTASCSPTSIVKATAQAMRWMCTRDHQQWPDRFEVYLDPVQPTPSPESRMSP
ncbi:MAG: hypothetical protein IPI81_14070 [Flavobacteriales bacterium]|nr:hypothetical protein [Flavobacteriales bacterium]